MLTKICINMPYGGRSPSNKMRVLFNATTLVKGGALQVAVAFIRQAVIDDEGIDWYYALSSFVLNELAEEEIERLRNRYTRFDVSPSRSRDARKKLKSLQKSTQCDAVFTLFGPAYVNFGVSHICGVADGWVTHSSLVAFRALRSPSSVLNMILTIVYKAYWFRKASLWVVEAENAKRGLIRRLWINANRIYTIPNTCSSLYRKKTLESRQLLASEKIIILCLSAYFKGKNLEIIPNVAQELSRLAPTLDFEFVITLPSDDEGYKLIKKNAVILGVEKKICNVGPVRVSDGPKIYEKCHIVFLPSLLETSSAVYPEAMAMGRPIVTTDLDFAHACCGDAAVFYRPKNARAAADKILDLINNPALVAKIVNAGRKMLEKLPTPEERYIRYVEIVKHAAPCQK